MGMSIKLTSIQEKVQSWHMVNWPGSPLEEASHLVMRVEGLLGEADQNGEEVSESRQQR